MRGPDKRSQVHAQKVHSTFSLPTTGALEKQEAHPETVKLRGAPGMTV